MTSSRRALAALLLATSFALSPLAARDARADAPSPADLASARDLVRQGREARRAGDRLGALEKFKAAYALAQTAVTAIELARAYEAVGQLVEARELCLAIGRMPVEPDETHLSADARVDAARLAEQLRPRIPAIVVRIAGLPAGEAAEVSVDGARLPPEAIGETRKVDPGTHAITARHDAEVVDAHVTVDEGETKAIVLTLHPSARPPKPAGAAQPVVAPPSHDQAPPAPRSHALAYVGFGVAGAGLVAGTITGLLAFSKKSSIDGVCVDQRCPPAAYDDLDAGRALGTASTIAFGVGLVGAAVGIYALVRDADLDARDSSAGVSVSLGPGSALIHGSF